MAELLQENWWLLVIALVIGVLVAWWIFAANRKTTIEREPQEDDARVARRNQALIDAPPAATGAPSPAASPANADVVAAATATADAEAGASVAPSMPPVEEAPAVAEPEPVASPPASDSSADDLSQIKGLGPKLKTMLNDLGVTSFAQIAAWDDAEIDRIDAQLGRFQGRIRRDSWVEQAKLLSAGDKDGYESVYGRT